jgi:O-antigen/teichoic acid export membrane protein
MTPADESAVGRARSRLISGLRSHATAHVVALSARFALVPYVLSRLPRDEYGLWAWMLTLSAFLVLAELGFTQGLVHPLARALAADDRTRIGRLLSAAAAVPAGAVALVAAGVFVLRGPIAAAASTDSGVSPLGVLLPLVAAQGVSLCALPLLSLLSGLQRLDLAHALRLPATALQVGGTVLLLESGGGALSLAWLQLGLALFQLGARWLACARLVPGLALGAPTRADLVELRAVGTPMILLNLLWAMALGFERAFLGWIADLDAFAQYAVASRLVLIVLEVQQIPGTTLLQTSAALEAAGERAALARLYERSLRLTALVVAALVGSLVVAGPPFLHAWVGPGFEVAGGLVGLLAVALLVPGLCQPGIALLGGRSRLGRASALFAAWAAACVVVDSLWLLRTGFAGAGYALAVVNVAGTLVFLRAVRDEEGGAAAGGIILRVLAAAAPAVVVGLGVRLGASGALGPGRVAGVALAGLAGAAFLASFLLVAARLGAVTRADRSLVAELAGRRFARFLRTGRSGTRG